MLKLDFERYSDLPSASWVVDDNGLVIASKSLETDCILWDDIRGQDRYVIGYIPVVGGHMLPHSFTSEPLEGHHIVIATSHSIYRSPRKIISVDKHFERDLRFE